MGTNINSFLLICMIRKRHINYGKSKKRRETHDKESVK